MSLPDDVLQAFEGIDDVLIGSGKDRDGRYVALALLCVGYELIRALDALVLSVQVLADKDPE